MSILRKLQKKEGRSFRHPLQITISLGGCCYDDTPKTPLSDKTKEDAIALTSLASPLTVSGSANLFSLQRMILPVSKGEGLK
jgi:hypothetical protein